MSGEVLPYLPPSVAGRQRSQCPFVTVSPHRPSPVSEGPGQANGTAAASAPSTRGEFRRPSRQAWAFTHSLAFAPRPRAKERAGVRGYVRMRHVTPLLGTRLPSRGTLPSNCRWISVSVLSPSGILDLKNPGQQRDSTPSRVRTQGDSSTPLPPASSDLLSTSHLARVFSGVPNPAHRACDRNHDFEERGAVQRGLREGWSSRVQ